MTIIHPIRTDLVRPGLTPRVYAMQFDTNTRVVELTLTAQGEPWIPPEGSAFALSYRKPDGTRGFYSELPQNVSAVTVAENRVSVTLAPQVLTAPGIVEASLVLTEAGGRAGAFPFQIHVTPDPGAGTETSDDYFNYRSGSGLIYYPAATTRDLTTLETLEGAAPGALMLSASGQLFRVDAVEEVVRLTYLTDLGTHWEATQANSLIAIGPQGQETPVTLGEHFRLKAREADPTRNLYDPDSMIVVGAWYVRKIATGQVILQQDANTSQYQAIRIPLPEVSAVTLSTIAPYYPAVYNWFVADAQDRILAQGTAGMMQYLHQEALTIFLPEGAAALYMSMRFGVYEDSLAAIMAAIGDEALPYVPYAPQEDLGMVLEAKNTLGLSLAKSYCLVVGDTFELFWKGVIQALNPEAYYIEAVCPKGTPYRKRFVYTPGEGDIGDHSLTVNVYDAMHTLLATGRTTLSVKAKAADPPGERVVLYVGDSLANGGQVPDEFYRRLTQEDGLGNLSFIGTCASSRLGVLYEGYGGWNFHSYNTENKSSAFLWLTAPGHTKTQADQHSLYRDQNGTQWKLETVEEDRLKVIRTSGSGTVSGELTWISGGSDTGPILYTASAQAPGNPFWDEASGAVDFGKYAQAQGKSAIDYVYVLLGWNSLGAEDSAITADAKTFISNVHRAFPHCQVVLLGLQVPALEGLAHNYGASKTWTYYNALAHVMRLNRLYGQLAKEDPLVGFVQISGQFDTENGMPVSERTVNVRSSTKEKFQSNGVHPMTAGYYQIADACCRDLHHRLQA